MIKDANIPTTCVTGAVTGGTGDVIAVLKEDDLILYEGVVRLRAMPDFERDAPGKDAALLL